jgi:hypothetical protein
MPSSPRRFPPPWTIEELNDACFVVSDRTGQKFAYVYFEDEPGRCAHLPRKSTIMYARTIPLLVSLLIAPLLAQSAQSASTQPVRWHPCAQIRTACTRAGFVPNGAKMGAGIMVDCIQPIIAGTPQRKQAAKALPQIDPQVVAACIKRSPNFGKGARKTQPSGA